MPRHNGTRPVYSMLTGRPAISCDEGGEPPAVPCCFDCPNDIRAYAVLLSFSGLSTAGFLDDRTCAANGLCLQQSTKFLSSNVNRTFTLQPDPLSACEWSYYGVSELGKLFADPGCSGQESPLYDDIRVFYTGVRRVVVRWHVYTQCINNSFAPYYRVFESFNNSSAPQAEDCVTFPVISNNRNDISVLRLAVGGTATISALSTRTCLSSSFAPDDGIGPEDA